MLFEQVQKVILAKKNILGSGALLTGIQKEESREEYEKCCYQTGDKTTVNMSANV